MKTPLNISASNQLSRQLLIEQAIPLLVIFILSGFFNLTLEDALNALSKTQDTERWQIQLALGIWDLVETLIVFLILSWGIPKVRQLTEAHFQKKPFGESYLNSFLAEYLRMMAQALMYGLLLVLPGIFRYSQLIFVPYLAIFAKPYRDGNVDALKLSEDLTRGYVWRYIGALVATTALGSLVEMLPELVADLHVLPVRVLCHAISFFISIWLYAFLYLQFEAAMAKYDWSKSNGTHV